MLRDLEQPRQHLAEDRRYPGLQQVPAGRDSQDHQRGDDQAGQHEVGPPRWPQGIPG